MGIELLGRPFSEPTLIRLAFAYEQATMHRHPPASTPPLDCNRNGTPDEDDVLTGSSPDENHDGFPDECESSLEVSVKRIDFGAVYVGTWATVSFDLRNTGRGEVAVTEISIGSPLNPNPDLRLSVEFQPRTLAPGEMVSYSITYAPSAPESDRETLTVLSDARTGSRLTILLEGAGLEDTHPRFLRGDCNSDGAVDISDAACILNWLFADQGDPGCVAATNMNGDRAADISDATYLLNHLFSGGRAPVAPFPECGSSELEADSALGCVTSCQ